MQVLQASELVTEGGLADDADERRRSGGRLAVGEVLGLTGWGLKDPGIVFGAAAGDWFAHGNVNVTVTSWLPSRAMARQATNPFEALADPHRRAILELLHGGERSVREIADEMPITRPAVSRHLRLLKEAGLVASSPEGTRRLYRLHDEGLDAVRAYLSEVWGDAATRFRLTAENLDPK